MPASTRITHQVLRAGYQVFDGKGHTNYAIALATARIVEAVLNDERQVLPVSTLLTGYADISDVCLSVPTVLGRAGALSLLPTPLSPTEQQGLHRSAQAIRAVIDDLEIWSSRAAIRARHSTICFRPFHPCASHAVIAVNGQRLVGHHAPEPRSAVGA